MSQSPPPEKPQGRTDGVRDDADFTPAPQLNADREREVVPRYPTDPGVTRIPSQGALVRKPPMFSRGVSGDESLWMRLFSFLMTTGILGTVLLGLGGIGAGAYYGWKFLRPELDALGYPFSSHQCTLGPSETREPLLSALPAFVLTGQPSPQVRQAFSRGQRVVLGQGKEARAVPFSAGVIVFTRDPARPGGVGVVAVQFTKPRSFCAVLGGTGLVTSSAWYEVSEGGVVQGPFPPELRVQVSPERGRVGTLQLSHR